MAGRHTPLDMPRRAGAIALLAAVATSAGLAQAAAPGYEIQVGVIESDNIERLPSGGTDQTIGVLGLDFTWHDKRPWLDADIEADVSHLHYFQHTYSDEFVGNLLGAVKISLVQDLLSWRFADNFGQVPLQPLEPITPANRENINYFSTGPELSLPLGQTTQLGVIGQYAKVDYQVSPLDSTNLTGGIGLLHELSPVTNISINARDDSIRFANDQLNPDYDRQEVFGRFDTKGSRTTLGLDLGYSHVHLPGFSDGIPLARLDLSRRVSASSTVGIALGHDYSDGADSFRLVQAVGGATLNTLPVVAAGPPFVSNYGTFAWTFEHARTTLGLTASYFQDRYQTDALLNNDRTVVDARAARQITPVVRLALTEDIVRWEFTGEGERATTSDTALQLTWRVGSRVSVFLAYSLAKGSGNVPGFEYTENRVWLSIGYGRAAEVPPGPAPVRLPVMQ
ncbi:MAG TPA: hypothetical protein VMW56_05145 [Candidatus Margulisiibacteriota bacterium]|nr:hypothetical protein [Candidatus Margulisiibacteriota bacterium]